MKHIPIQELLTLLGAEHYAGNNTTVISGLIDLLNDVPETDGQLAWCNEKNLWRLADLKTGTIIISKEALPQIGNKQINLVVVDKPRAAFKTVLETYFVQPRKSHFVAKSATVHTSVNLPEDGYIGENVVIEEHCSIGSGVFIGSNTVIHTGTIIENNVTIGCNNTIGGVGFGYEKNSEGAWEVMPHAGNVIIREKTEIGNNTCIDRAVLGSTIIGRNVKIDNLVHIAHGVKISDNALIIAHAMIGGSAVIGKNVWFGPSASVLNKGVIGDNAFIGMAAVVVKPVEENTVVAGNPARFLRNNTDGN